MPAKYITVYGTQGGGLARKVGSTYIWFELPEWGNFVIGDEIPQEWDIQGPFKWYPNSDNSQMERAPE